MALPAVVEVRLKGMSLEEMMEDEELEEEVGGVEAWAARRPKLRGRHGTRA